MIFTSPFFFVTLNFSTLRHSTFDLLLPFLQTLRFLESWLPQRKMSAVTVNFPYWLPLVLALASQDGGSTGTGFWVEHGSPSTVPCHILQKPFCIHGWYIAFHSMEITHLTRKRKGAAQHVEKEEEPSFLTNLTALKYGYALAIPCGSFHRHFPLTCRWNACP